MTDIPSDWYDGYFEEEWLDEIALHIPEERTRKEVDFLLERLELEPGARVLDVACGHGRHSLELARRGFDVTGVDLSTRSIALAREAAEREGLGATFVERDARELDFDGEFDAAINLFTSAIGYFDEEAENQRVVDGVARALRRGGSFLVDTINLLALARGFRELDWDEYEAGTIMVERREFDFESGRSRASWMFVGPDGSRKTLRHSLRIYAPHELFAMFDAAGLDVAGSWGNFDGDELSFEAWRTDPPRRQALMESPAKHTIAIASGKGGVGKSTVTLNLALALARDASIGILDADLYGPDIPAMLGLTRLRDAKRWTLWSDDRKRLRPIEERGLKVMSSAFLLGETQVMPWSSLTLPFVLRQLVTDVEWGELDYLLVDLPPGTADLQEQVFRMLPLAGVLLVVGPQDVAHLDAKKVVTLVRDAGVPLLGAVENMSGFVCPHCGERHDVFPRVVEERSLWSDGIERLAEIPLDPALARTNGVPPAFEQLAETLAHRLAA